MSTTIELGKFYVNFRGDKVRMNGNVKKEDGTLNYFIGSDGCPYQPNGDFLSYDGNRHENLSIKEEYKNDVFHSIVEMLLKLMCQGPQLQALIQPEHFLGGMQGTLPHGLAVGSME